MTAADYEILAQTAGAQPLGPLGSVARCAYARAQNAIGELSLTYVPGTLDPGLLQPFNRLLVQRQIGATQPYIDLNVPWFILNGPYRTLDSQGVELMRVDAVDPIGLILATRNIAYNDYTSYSDKLAAYDDMLKALVRENAGALATDTNRDLTGQMNVAPDTAQAPVGVMTGMARHQLLDMLQDIADASANDATTPTWLGFDVVLVDQKTGLLEFQTFVGQRGVDHRFPAGNPPVIFSDEQGNLANVETATLYGDSASFIYAGGAGVGTIRAVATASDAALIARSPFGRREKWLDASQVVDPAALEALAASELRNARPRRYLTGQVSEINATLRGVQWDFGDLATAFYQSETFDVRVDKVAVTLEPGDGGGLVGRSQVYLRGESSV